MVDASQGVEAQTVANAFLASRHNLTIIPVINKIDLPAAQPDFVKEQIENVLAIPADDALADQREKRPRCRRSARSDREARADAKRLGGCAAAGADFRFLVRHLPRRGGPGARDGRPHRAADEDSPVRQQRSATKWKRSARSRRNPSCSTSWPRATWASSSPISSAWPMRAWAIRWSRPTDPRRPCPDSKPSNRWSSRAYFP